MLIRPANSDDRSAIWRIIGPTIRAGETYALDRDLSEADALAYWMGPDRETFVAEEGGGILGTYYIKANQAGGGRHICNCGYMTDAAAAGRGVARRMHEHSLEHARTRASGLCSSTSSSAAIAAPLSSGNRSASTSSAGFPVSSSIRRKVMSTHW